MFDFYLIKQEVERTVLAVWRMSGIQKKSPVDNRSRKPMFPAVGNLSRPAYLQNSTIHDNQVTFVVAKYNKTTGHPENESVAGRGGSNGSCTFWENPKWLNN